MAPEGCAGMRAVTNNAQDAVVVLLMMYMLHAGGCLRRTTGGSPLLSIYVVTISPLAKLE